MSIVVLHANGDPLFHPFTVVFHEESAEVESLVIRGAEARVRVDGGKVLLSVVVVLPIAFTIAKYRIIDDSGTLIAAGPVSPARFAVEGQKLILEGEIQKGA